MSEGTGWSYSYGGQSRREQLKLLLSVHESRHYGYVDRGPMVTAFEQAAAQLVGTRTAIAMGTGTAAFESICHALGVGGSDEVVVPEFSWVTIPSVVAKLGAHPRIATVDRSLCTTWEHVSSTLSPSTRAVVVVHPRGRRAPEVALIAEQLSRREVPLIEDCAQAWVVCAGSSRAHVGRHGVAAFFSTQANKLVNTGEGGMVVTTSEALAAQLGQLLIPGVVCDPRWLHSCRMTELQAAVGLAQLRAIEATAGALRSALRLAAQAIAPSALVETVVPGLGPDGRETEPTNGTVLGVWLQDEAAVEQVRARLDAERILYFDTGNPGDLHFAHAWPVASDLEWRPAWFARLLELPVPETTDGGARWASLLAAAFQA